MKRIIPIIIIIAAVAGGYWWYTQPTASAVNGSNGSDQAGRLVGSGSVEAETVAITAELGGRVLAVHAAEGDEVAAGDRLIELDQADLLARQVELEAAIETAQANLQLVSASALPEDVALAEAQLAQAEAARDGAELVWRQAQRLAANPHELEARINQMRAQVTDAEKQLEEAKIALKRAEIQAEAASRDQSNNVGLAKDEAAQLRLQAAQQAVPIAEVALEGLRQQVEHLVKLRDRPLALIAQANAAGAAFHQAEAAVQAAQANLLAAKADPTAEDVNVARAQVQQAEAGLSIVEVQLDKQQLTAPRAGLISKRLIEPGELAGPGTILMELSDIETVELTVYIPETQIGRVQIGHTAKVYVDAYPNEVFEGWVSFIAHEAEFTPRNVQTEEERVNLVFGVKIKLDNADHRLKPGMPADAEIVPEAWPGLAEASTAAGAAAPPAVEPTSTATPTPPPAATPAPTLAPTVAQPTAAPPATTAEILAWGLKVRQGPSLDEPVVGYLSQGDVVQVLATDEASGWLRVQGTEAAKAGWIANNAEFVSLREN